MNVSNTSLLTLASSLLMTACGGSSSSQVPIPSSAAFIEKDGVVVVEMESNVLDDTDWRLKADPKASGGYAIEWLGGDKFFEPGVGVVKINVKITNPGSYRFDWANQIGEGEKTTEANDTWLKINANKFYGKNENSIVCPHGFDASQNNCQGETPEGTGGGGWLKVYRFDGPASDYLWSTYTSDRDPHAIYADFEQPGTYTIQIAGRSKHHVIDRFIMSKDPASHEATKQAPESARLPK